MVILKCLFRDFIFLLSTNLFYGVGNSPCVRQEWFHRVECFGYEEFADLRYVRDCSICIVE